MLLLCIKLFCLAVLVFVVQTMFVFVLPKIRDSIKKFRILQKDVAALRQLIQESSTTKKQPKQQISYQPHTTTCSFTERDILLFNSALERLDELEKKQFFLDDGLADVQECLDDRDSQTKTKLHDLTSSLHTLNCRFLEFSENTRATQSKLKYDTKCIQEDRKALAKSLSQAFNKVDQGLEAVNEMEVRVFNVEGRVLSLVEDKAKERRGAWYKRVH